MNEWLEKIIFNNSLQDYLISAGMFVVLYLAVRLFGRIVMWRLKKWSEKTENTLDDFLVDQIQKRAVPLLYIISLYISLHALTLSEIINQYVNSIFVILLTAIIVRFTIALLKYLIMLFWKKDEAGGGQESIKGISGFISVIMWSLGAVFVLDNLGFKISTIVAGLGIGGIAIALAAQAVLGDLFGYIVIFFDKPFKIGDFIVVDDKVGAVEYIGIKTTRIRSLSGEQLVFSNKDLTDSRIHNFKKMEQRRVVFNLGVTYQTSFENVKLIPGLVKSLIEEQSEVRFDRSHFKEYGNFSLIFETVYYVFGADYNKYMDIQQAINLRIYEEFEKRGIEFAYPTQTLFLNKEQ